MENIIELKHITKNFDDNFTAVDDFNLEVQRGEFVTFLGPSGCGKTTTLRMIAGFEMPTEGEILLNGKDISKLPPNKRPINTVFQRYALFPHLNIYDNIAFGLKLKKLPKAEIEKKVKKALEMVEQEHFEDADYFQTFSYQYPDGKEIKFWIILDERENAPNILTALLPEDY